LASPVNFAPKDPINDVIEPAISGTRSILNSAHKYGKNVKHVIVMSSVASILNLDLDPSHALNEEDWNDGAMELVKQFQETGQDLMEGIAYMASKNESERVLWQFRKEKQPSFTLTTLLPTWVYGTIIPPPATEQEVKAASTAKLLVDYFSGENQDARFAYPLQGWVHVTDVARAHLLVIRNADKTDGERYVLNAGKYSFQRVVDILREHFPERRNVIAKGEPSNYPEPMRNIDGSKITREIGLQYYSDFEQTVLDTIKGVEQFYKL
jgi:nucleoside-diphosphate-sugar epimerase